MSARLPLSHVVVLGRDTDLWLSVNALVRALRSAGVRVTAVELPTRLSPVQISASLPPLEALHSKLGIEESALLRLTGGSFSLGHNFLSPRQSYFHAWAAYGAPIEGKDFFACWLRATRRGFKVPLRSFCLTAMAAQNGRMLIPDEATAAFGRNDYGYHFQTWDYVAYLKSLAVRLGVECHQVRDVEVERASDGSMAALRVDGARRIEGQFFVDASGSDAVLTGRVLQVPRESWRQHFQVDRILSARAPAFTSVPPFAEVRASGTGWTLLRPSRLATGVVRAFCSDLMGDEAALESANAVAGVKLTDANCQASDPYIRARAWEGNCAAVGRAACNVDPIHDVDLHVLQLGLVHLLSLFPVCGEFAAERVEYNRVMRSHCERIRDFQCAYYALSTSDGEFWQRARRVGVPDSLAHKILTFRACGRIPPLEDETFSLESWQALLIGSGLVPDATPAVTERIPLGRLNESFGRILGFIQAKVLEQPTHNDYLSSLLQGVARPSRT
jgi:tryptophan 7-halogenase